MQRPPPVSIEQPPSMNTPKNPAVNLNEDDVFVGKRTPKRAKPPEKSVIDRASDSVRELIGRVTDSVRQIGRERQPEPTQPAPVVPR